MLYLHPLKTNSRPQRAQRARSGCRHPPSYIQTASTLPYYPAFRNRPENEQVMQVAPSELGQSVKEARIKGDCNPYR